MLGRGDTFEPQATQGHVLCCMCGAAILPNSSNMCVNCLRSRVDITEGLQKQATILWCKQCGRYLQPPKHWLRAEPESKELLTFCLKKIKGLQKVKLVDAGFLWTEPHSRRLKVKVTVQAEVFNGAILQQSFVVEYVVETHMCPECERQNTNPNTWVAAVQVRQHTEHKRTFFYLEQLILKHNADANCISIRNIHEGVDFYFSNRAHAQKFVDFLQSVVPVRFRQAKQLVSHKTHTSTYNYKYTFSVEIVPICKDDLVCLPSKLAASLGNMSPIAVCTRVTNVLALTDSSSLRTVHIDATAYWRHPFRPIMRSKQLEEFVVLDIESAVPTSRRHVLADVQLAKASDLGSNDRTHLAKTHLGHLLHAGDAVLAYDLTTAQLTDPELEKNLDKGLLLPDVVPVRKSYEAKRRRRKARGHQRQWQLKRLLVDEAADSGARGRGRHGGSAGEAREDADQERFLEELEEDAELRSKIEVYRKPGGTRHAEMQADTDDDDVPDVPLEELLEDLSAMQITDTDMSLVD